MHNVGNPNEGQFTGTQQSCEHHGVASVILLPVARSNRGMAWRDDLANKSQGLNLSKDVVAARAGLIDEISPSMTARKLLYKF